MDLRNEDETYPQKDSKLNCKAHTGSLVIRALALTRSDLERDLEVSFDISNIKLLCPFKLNLKAKLCAAICSYSREVAAHSGASGKRFPFESSLPPHS